MSTDPERLYPIIRASAPGVSDFLMQPAVMQAARDFCSQTWAWWIEVVLSVDEEGTVSPDFDPSAEYFRVYQDGVALNEIYRDYWTDTTNIIGILKVEKDGRKFEDYSFAPPLFQVNERWQGETFDLAMRLALEPATTASTLPDFLVERFGQVIAYGALAELLMQPQQDWTNPNLAQDRLRKFRSGMAQARMANLKNYTYGSARVQAKRFI